MYTHVRPPDESVMNYVALLWVQVGQPWTLQSTSADICCTFVSVLCHDVRQWPHNQMKCITPIRCVDKHENDWYFTHMTAEIYCYYFSKSVTLPNVKHRSIHPNTKPKLNFTTISHFSLQHTEYKAYHNLWPCEIKVAYGYSQWHVSLKLPTWLKNMYNWEQTNTHTSQWWHKSTLLYIKERHY